MEHAQRQRIEDGPYDLESTSSADYHFDPEVTEAWLDTITDDSPAYVEEEDLLVSQELAEDILSDVLEAPLAFAELADEDTTAEILEDPLRMYMRDIKRYPLLTRVQELQLARRLRLKRDESAFRQLVESNLRLAASCAHRYVGRGVALLDLIQEANIGLMKGTQRFDDRRGYKFSTYVTWWIKQALGRAVQQYGRVIYVPAYAHEGHNKIQKARYRLYQELGRWPTDEEVEADIGEQRDGSWDVERIDTVASLDEPFQNGDANDAYLGNLVADPEPDNAAKVERIRLREEIDQCLMLLRPREEAVIRLRFGLNDAEREYTLSEVGRELHVTRERIRQIELVALKKLRRSPAVKASLKDFH